MLILLDRFQRVLDVDRASGLVRVQGGVSIARLNTHLAAHGLALENLGDIDVQSIAGAISTATHGTGARLRNIPSQVAALTLVLADGSTLACSPERDPELFRAARVGLGALGVVAEVTLRCVPAFTLCGIDAPASLEQTLERFEELTLANEHFEFYVFPHCEHGADAHQQSHRGAHPRRARASRVRQRRAADQPRLRALFCRLGRRMPNRIPEINRLVTRLAGSSQAIDRSDRIFASPRLVRFTEMEYALAARAHHGGRAPRAGAGASGGAFAVPFPIEVRTVAPDDALLSTATGRDSGYVAVHMYRRYAVAALLPTRSRQIMDELDGRPHWGKRHFQTRRHAACRATPSGSASRRCARGSIPEGRFANALDRSRARPSAWTTAS